SRSIGTGLPSPTASMRHLFEPPAFSLIVPTFAIAVFRKRRSHEERVSTVCHRQTERRRRNRSTAGWRTSRRAGATLPATTRASETSASWWGVVIVGTATLIDG